MRCIGLIFASKLLNYCKVSDRLWLALEVKPYSGVFSWVSAGCCFFCLGLLAGDDLFRDSWGPWANRTANLKVESQTL